MIETKQHHNDTHSNISINNNIRIINFVPVFFIVDVMLMLLMLKLF